MGGIFIFINSFSAQKRCFLGSRNVPEVKNVPKVKQLGVAADHQ